MKHFKIKTLLLILVTAMLIGAALVMIYYPHSHVRLSGSDIDTVVEVLKKKRISIDKDVIPTVTYSMPTATMTAAYPTPEELAGVIFGGNFKAVDNAVKKDGVTISTSPQIFIKCDTPKLDFKGITEKNAVKRVKKLINRYDIDIRDSIMEVYENDGDDGVNVIVTQTYEGFPVFDNALTFDVSAKGLKSVSGMYFLPDTKQGSVTPKSPIDALVRFSQDWDNYGSNIIGIEQGYRLDVDKNGITATLTPTWSILTSNGKAYYVSA